MKLLQYKGPFTAGETIEIPSKSGFRYVQIGIQVPKRQPIQYEVDKQAEADIRINGTVFKVNEKCVLEFDELSERTLTIRAEQALPWETIIDIGYDVTGH